MAFWRRKATAPEVRVPARGTVVEVGASVLQSQQSATSLRLRLRVAPEGAGAYEVTTAWTVDAGLVPKVVEGASFQVDVVEAHPEQVHPRDGRMHWDRTRTPDDPKVRAVDDGGAAG
ncbi:MAG TPA: hypothetical protein PKA98_14240 [Acidimicrobiales bacterium]|nr:hypothetical protein [Acidimicrobiales bacterium]